ncbi:DNA adenine methylase [Rosenbergiella epipactidis]|uniref:DNA adenine methylase n=1 Tax=Rosenbergiella epipactidis TaxID=1544694 RepID=UPI001BDA944D|nr:DNA adenine methylase [Rosenbergiella epipactidis]MBT0719434.1 DNA adenine methylase [Rosenbergiella epipactidis]
MSTILKWAGNKSAVMLELAKHLPHGSRLVEPFAGSCAVMMETDYPEYLIADVNPDLINLYVQIQANTSAFLTHAKAMFTQGNNSQLRFNAIRQAFNQGTLKGGSFRAALFLFLNRHCYRGLCRYNQKGQFNVPYGNYKKPYFPEREILAFAEKAKRATFLCAGYQDTLKQLKTGDVVYCDPPYDDTFASYHTSGFNKADQQELANHLEGLASYFPVIASNSDTPYIREIYKGFEVNELTTKRCIGVCAGESKQANEVILTKTPMISFLGLDYARLPYYSAVSRVPQ